MAVAIKAAQVKGVGKLHDVPALFLAHRIHGTGIFTYIWLSFVVNVGKYTINGSYGLWRREMRIRHVGFLVVQIVL